jgi:hypothetical protein
VAEHLTLTYGYTAKDLAAVRAYAFAVAPSPSDEVGELLMLGIILQKKT